MSNTPREPRTCWCGCSRTISREAEGFVGGHDKKAEAYLNALMHHGSIIERLDAAGFGPRQRNLRDEVLARGLFEACDIGDCTEIRRPGREIRAHRRDQHGA
jgi:hypothetical protein